MKIGCYLCVVVILLTAPANLLLQAQPLEPRTNQNLDDTGAFIHLAPGLVNTTNGCSEFTISVIGTFTDARVFGLRFSFDQANLELVSVTPGTDTTLHILPERLSSDTLWLDGFFHPNFAAGSVTLATLLIRAIAPDDASTMVGFLFGEGFGGTPDNPETLVLTGDTTYVQIEGTAPLAPQGLIIQRLPYPAQADSIRLMWNRVHYDVSGDPVVNPLYIVYREDITNAPGIYDSVGAVLDTVFYDDFITFTFSPGDTGVVNAATFKVETCKTQP